MTTFWQAGQLALSIYTVLSHYSVKLCFCNCRNNLVTITELLESIRKLQDISDSRKYKMIAEVLDEDHDGVLDKADVKQVITSIHVF